MAGLFEGGYELGAAVHLDGGYGKGHALAERLCTPTTSQRETTSMAVKCLRITPSSGRTSRVSTWTRSPGPFDGIALGFAYGVWVSTLGRRLRAEMAVVWMGSRSSPLCLALVRSLPTIDSETAKPRPGGCLSLQQQHELALTGTRPALAHRHDRLEQLRAVARSSATQT